MEASDEILLTFPRTTAAIAAESALLSAGIPVRVMPVPASIRAGCGICLRLPPAQRPQVTAALATAEIAVEGYHLRARGEIRPLLATERLLSAALGIGLGDTVAVIGAGGKTSLLYALAREWRAAPVAISMTTKMLPPPPGAVDRIVKAGEDTPVDAPTPGITLYHGPATPEGKLTAPPMAVLEALSGPDGLLLLEADGARGLPLKGWAAYEPVMVQHATVTVGVVPVSVLGRALDAETVHRPDAFARLTGLAPGDTITERALASMISAPEGLFAKARGHRALFFTQAESNAARTAAEGIYACLPPDFAGGLSRVAMGSARGGYAWGIDVI